MIVAEAARLTCPSCPSQWEGTTRDGQIVYARYRFGRLYVGIGPTLIDAVRGESYSQVLGDEMHGELAYSELKQATADRFVWPLEAPIGRSAEI